jgi:hypothetical protein
VSSSSRGGVYQRIERERERERERETSEIQELHPGLAQGLNKFHQPIRAELGITPGGIGTAVPHICGAALLVS